MSVTQTTSRFALLAFLVPFLAAAGGPSETPTPEGMTVSQVIPRATITHYAATPKGGSPCRHECYKGKCVGGPDASPSGVRPLSATIDKPGSIRGRTAVLTAVPQRGGNASMFGCFFAIPDVYPGTLFFAGDRYGPDSNGKFKTDVSTQCESKAPWKGGSPYRVKNSKTSKLIVYNCPGIKGIKASVARDKPTKVPASVARAPAPKSEPDELKPFPSEDIAPAPVASAPKKKRKPTVARESRPPTRHRREPAAARPWTETFWEDHMRNSH